MYAVGIDAFDEEMPDYSMFSAYHAHYDKCTIVGSHLGESCIGAILTSL